MINYDKKSSPFGGGMRTPVPVIKTILNLHAKSMFWARETGIGGDAHWPRS